MERTSPPLLIDTHCHLADPAFAERLPAAIRNAKEAGVAIFIAPGTFPGDWHRLQALQKLHPEVAPAYGLHPMHSRLFSRSLLETLGSLAPSAVAIGEIGLDYTLTIPREIQQEAFRRQLQLALACRLPVLIHCRKAFQDLLSILREQAVERIHGVMHAYSGSVETAIRCMQMGLHISLAGTVTFGNAVRPVAVAREIPLSNLLLETDAPDLSPEPYRDRQNEPAFIIATAEKIAEIKGMTIAEIATATTRNAVELFELSLSGVNLHRR